MRTTQQISITLPKEMADAVKDKVRSGEYATESELIRDGLRALLARDQVVEKWLRDTVVPAAEALRAGPGRPLLQTSARAFGETQEGGRQDPDISYTIPFSPAARDQLAELEDYIRKIASPVVTSMPLSRIAKRHVPDAWPRA